MTRIRQRPSGVVLACLLIIALARPCAPSPASALGLGSVSGVVTGGGAPLGAAWVVLTPVTASGDWAGESMLVAADQWGGYSFQSVPAGHVKVHVRSPLTGGFVETYWPGVYTFGQAGTIPVTASGFVADIDLPVGRSIRGQVVAADTGEPVAGAHVIARIADAPWSAPAGRFDTGSGPGQFEIGGLPPVPIRLHVQVPPGSPFLGDGYWSDGTESVRYIDAPGDVTGLVIALPRGGAVSGTVRDGTGRPVAGAFVRLENCQYVCPREATTDESGRYRIAGIAPSSRTIVHSWATGRIDQWYDRADDWIAATSLSLGPGEARSGVDFVLVTGGVLVGRVLAGDTGRALTGVRAHLQAVSDPNRRYFAHFTEDDPDHYRIGPVPPDAYRLVLFPNSSQTQYRPARWVTATGIAASGIIRIAPGQQADVVVTLARTQPRPLGCTLPGSWQGLLRGFLGPDPWPLARPCAPVPGAPAGRLRTQRDWSVTGLAKTTHL